VAGTFSTSLAINHATGLYLFAWTIFTLYMTFGAWRTNLAVFTVFVLLSITFLLLTIGTLT
jgi:uncharacterized protein